jgi:hypothetical protein
MTTKDYGKNLTKNRRLFLTGRRRSGDLTCQTRSENTDYKPRATRHREYDHQPQPQKNGGYKLFCIEILVDIKAV